MRLEFVPRRRLLESLEAGWSLVAGHEYQASDWAILMAAPGTAQEADAGAIMRFFNPPHLNLSNMVRRNMGRCQRVVNCPRGHAYTEENTRMTKRGRKCRACERLRYLRSIYSAVRA